MKKIISVILIFCCIFGTLSAVAESRAEKYTKLFSDYSWSQTGFDDTLPEDSDGQYPNYKWLPSIHLPDDHIYITGDESGNTYITCTEPSKGYTCAGKLSVSADSTVIVIDCSSEKQHGVFVYQREEPEAVEQQRLEKTFTELVNPLDYVKTTLRNALVVGLPVLYLTGDTASMTKENAVDLEWTYGEQSGSCSCKWQGASSSQYSKKNYTIKFDTEVDAGWGNQKKYCLKANYIDHTSALNICSAKIWASIVADRGANPAIKVGANNGAMDGFPVILMLNGEFHGLYTLNTPKDKWTFGMGNNATEYLVTAKTFADSTFFNAEANLDGTDYELEYADETVPVETIKDSLNKAITEILNASGSSWRDAVDPYLDVDSAIDYMIFSALLYNADGIGKNFILTSYDGTKWWFNAYDLDTTFGNHWNGGSYYDPYDRTCTFAKLASKSTLFRLIYENNRSDLIERYKKLRSGLLSEGNVYKTFYNFCARIPSQLIDLDDRKWPEKPGTSTETLSRIMEFYRLRCEYIDAEIEALENK